MMKMQKWTGVRRAGWFATVAGLLMMAMSSSVAAQAAPGGMQGDEAGRKAVAQFELTEDFLHRVEAVSKDAESMKVRPSIDASQVHTLDEMAAKLDATPEAKALLDRHGLSAKTYLVGTFALAGAAMTVAMREDPKMAKYVDESRVNAANVKFYEQHRAEIDQLLHINHPAPGAGKP